MKIIGLTGGVGAGKSTVLEFLQKDWNAFVLQADQVGDVYKRQALESPFNNQLHTESHQSPLSGMSLNCLLLFLIGLTVYYFSTKMLFCQGLIFKAVNWRRDSSAALYKRITGERIYRHNRSIS